MPIATRPCPIPVRLGVFLAIASCLSAAGPARAASPETSRVTLSSTGVESDKGGAYFALSKTGRFVAFDSEGTTLAPGNGNGGFDVYVRDLKRRKTERVSVSSAGVEGDGQSYDPAISATGRHVAFTSSATNFVSGDTNGFGDVFVRDRKTRRTTRVSVASDGTEANAESNDAGISGNGRVVVFTSMASTLVDGDGNGSLDVFVHDRKTHETARVSVADDGTEGDGTSSVTTNQSSISGSGRYVVFYSDATNLVAGDTNDRRDIFVRDRKTRTTRRLSVSTNGTQANGDSYDPVISADGRWVAFTSSADNLVPDDTNGASDVFVHDRKTHETTRVSLASDGMETHGAAYDAGISADGRSVVFASDAADVVGDDVNQASDVFLRDRKLGTTTRLSVGAASVLANDRSFACTLSADGRVVGFDSFATNLVGDDQNGTEDVFVRGPLR
ncbi:MAG TPA: hypothetical protein VMJ49_11515 [Gaiellaceae bacterium]|nr:hypothetical protein [Gaiellaceae bacterium]